MANSDNGGLQEMAFQYWCKHDQDIRKTASFVGVSKDLVKRWKRINCWDERFYYQREVENENRYSKWDTDDEKTFIDTLGSHLSQDSGFGGRRLLLLIKYREAIEKRENWGYVDPIAVKEHLERRISEYAK